MSTPTSFSDLLDRVGVDPERPSELVFGGTTEAGATAYSGWFNVVGHIVSDARCAVAVEPGFKLYPMPNGLLAGSAFRELPMFRIEFTVELPRHCG